jgi:hypothetical protein
MKGIKGWVGACMALVLTACGSGSVQSPAFTPELQSLQVTPTSFTLATGEDRQLTATATFSTPPGSSSPTSVEDVTKKVNWSSSAADVATVTGEGLVAGVGAGTATISASFHGKTATSTVNGLGVVLRQVVITPQTGVTTPNGSVSYAAQGIFSDSPTPRALPADRTITWAIDSLGTLSNSTGTPVTVTAGTEEGIATLTATVDIGTEGSPQNVTGTARFVVGQVSALKVDPATLSRPVGVGASFTAIASFRTPSGGTAIPDQAVPAVWTATLVDGTTDPTVDSSCSTGISSCTVTGKSAGKVKVTASYLTFSADANLDVTEAILSSIAVKSLDPSVPISATRVAKIPLGAGPSFAVDYTYTDGITGGARSDADKVNWSIPASSTIISLAVDSGTNQAQVVSSAKGTSSLTATTGNVCADPEDPAVRKSCTDTISIEVTDAAVQSLLALRPSKAYVALNRQKQFIPVGKFSDGTAADLPVTSVSWSSDDETIASVVKTGASAGTATALQAPVAGSPLPATKIKASLNGSTAEADFVVTNGGCSIPVREADGATIQETEPLGVCLLCGVNNGLNVINDTDADFGQINVGVGLLNTYRGFDIKLGSQGGAAGSKPGFIISAPAGPLVLANVLAQLEVSTLSDGNVKESSAEGIGLRVDLLGITLIGGKRYEQALVAMDTSESFDGLRLRLRSGTATALQTINVFDACADSEPSGSELVGIDSIVTEPELPGKQLQVGSPVTFIARDLTGQAIYADAVTWTSSNHSVLADPAVGGGGGASGKALAAGTTVITATLKDQSQCLGKCSASYTLTVVQNYCSAPLTPENAKVDSGAFGLCLLCSVTDRNNVIDSSPGASPAKMNVNLAVLGGTSLSVSSKDGSAYTPGQPVGFLIGDPTTALSVDLLSQYEIRTLRNGAVQESWTQAGLLDLELLGLNVDLTPDTRLFRSAQPTTKAFDTVELRVSSLAGVTYSVPVYSACPATNPEPAAP